MGIRGRRSSADLALITGSGISTIQRPDPPMELTAEQGDEWRQIVNRLPADWFPRETWAVLAQLCRHITRARRLAQLIDAAEGAAEFDVKEYRDLLRSEEEQSRAITSISTKLRITNQATYDKSKKKPSAAPRPWTTVEG